MAQDTYTDFAAAMPGLQALVKRDEPQWPTIFATYEDNTEGRNLPRWERNRRARNNRYKLMGGTCTLAPFAAIIAPPAAIALLFFACLLLCVESFRYIAGGGYYSTRKIEPVLPAATSYTASSSVGDDGHLLTTIQQEKAVITDGFVVRNSEAVMVVRMPEIDDVEEQVSNFNQLVQYVEKINEEETQTFDEVTASYQRQLQAVADETANRRLNNEPIAAALNQATTPALLSK